MIWTLTVVLLFLWLIGFVSGIQLGMWVHVLLLLAIVTLVVNLVRKRA